MLTPEQIRSFLDENRGQVTQKSLAYEAGISVVHLCNVVNGKSPRVSGDVLSRIEQAMAILKARIVGRDAA